MYSNLPTREGIVENNRAISWQLVEFNSWVLSRKRERVLPKPLSSQDDYENIQSFPCLRTTSAAEHLEMVVVVVKGRFK